mmetsp:Transcript_61191/g.189564  ORF Transcript_61191/g.189564 Transcript_61191/m.189564 type:complete len:513 (+) Transcript_61191:77-1615(+)
MARPPATSRVALYCFLPQERSLHDDLLEEETAEEAVAVAFLACSQSRSACGGPPTWLHRMLGRLLAVELCQLLVVPLLHALQVDVVWVQPLCGRAREVQLRGLCLSVAMCFIRVGLVLQGISVSAGRLHTSLLDVPIQEQAEDEWGEDRGVEQRPNHNGERLLVEHVPRERHLCDQVGELGAADHRPSDHPAWLSHEESAADLRHDASKYAHDGALPKRREGQELEYGNRERHRAREEDADHPGSHALRLLDPDVVRVVRGLQASEGHTSDEAAPQVRAQQVGDHGVGNQHHDLRQEERLVLLQPHPPQACGALVAALGNLWHDHTVDDLGPELHSRNHGTEHEGDANDGCKHCLEQVEVATQAEQHVEQNQGKDVVHEGGRDDGLAKVLLQHAGLAQEPQGDAHARRRERRARRDAVGHHGETKGDKEDGANDERQDRSENSHATGRNANRLGLLKVEVHAALEDHQSNARVADEREHVRCEAAVVAHFRLAPLLEALREGCVLRSPAASA